MTQPVKVDSSSDKNRMSDLLHWALLIPLVLYTIGLVTIGLIVVLAPGSSIQLDFLRTAYSLLALPLPIAMIVALGMHQHWVMALLTAPLIAWVIFMVPIYMPKSPEAAANSQTIHVLTMNFLARNEPQIKAGAELLAASDADIIMLQEFGVPAAEYLEEALGELYPYQALDPQDGRYNYVRGQGVFSKFPITDSVYWQFTELPESHGNQRVVVDMDGQQVILYNVHPWPPFNLRHLPLIEFQDKDVSSNRGAVDSIIERVTAETDPVIMAGDLNTGDQFANYARFASILTDSFRVAGQGMGYTYPACGIGPLPSLIRLDYVFYSAPFQAMDARVIDSCGVSDHKAVMVSLALPVADSTD